VDAVLKTSRRLAEIVQANEHGKPIDMDISQRHAGSG